jgi:putative ABC transport system permease protein
MMRGFMVEQRQLPGFSTERLATGEILLGGTRYFDKTPPDMNVVTPQVERFYDQVLEQVRALPGVRRAGIISKLPLQVQPFPFTIVGRPEPDSPRRRPRADVNEVDAQAFDTLEIRLLRGRGIRESDVAASPWVAVVNRTFAERHFPGQDPLGKVLRLSMGDPGPASVDEPQPRTIVGVVTDVAYPSFFDEKPAAIYIPFRQHVWQYAREDEWLHTRKVLAIRTAVDPMTLGRSVRAAIAQVDRDQTLVDFKTMDDRVRTSQSVANSRFFASLFAAFGLLAVLLAMVGVYGVMSWIVSRRTSEFGIRLALGARASDIIYMLLGQSLRPILVGLLLGILGGYGLGRALNGMFFRMTAAEPMVFAGISLLMLGVALTAAWLPARRVTRIDPQHALRSQ